jgi:hypothetical protein
MADDGPCLALPSTRNRPRTAMHQRATCSRESRIAPSDAEAFTHGIRLVIRLAANCQQFVSTPPSRS